MKYFSNSMLTNNSDAQTEKLKTKEAQQLEMKQQERMQVPNVDDGGEVGRPVL